MRRDKVPMGQPPSGSGEGEAEEGTGGMGWAHRKGGESGRAGGTQRALHSARGRRRILALCGCWMASRSSTNTALWLWKGLLCRATDLPDTPRAEPVPALKVNTPALDWLWKTFLGWEQGFHPSAPSCYSASYEGTFSDGLVWVLTEQLNVCLLGYNVKYAGVTNTTLKCQQT